MVVGGVYLTPSGLHVVHVACVMLQRDHLGKVHVLVEELRRRRRRVWSVHRITLGRKMRACFPDMVKFGF